MKIKHKKRRMAVIFQTLAAYFFLILTSIFNSAYSNEFNAEYFKEQALAFHLKDEKVKAEYNLITDLRSEINTYIEYDKGFVPNIPKGCPQKVCDKVWENIWDEVWNKICTNIVGNTMMKLLIANLKVRRASGEDVSVRINYGTDDCCNRDEGEDSHINVFLKKGNYTEDYISKTIVCGIDKDMKIVPKFQSFSDILFHELNHTLHHMEGVYFSRWRKYNYSTELYKNVEAYKKDWTDDEELYNITGYVAPNIHDPVVCNIYDICQYCKLGVPIEEMKRRVYHCPHEEWMNGRHFKCSHLLADISAYIN